MYVEVKGEKHPCKELAGVAKAVYENKIRKLALRVSDPLRAFCDRTEGLPCQKDLLAAFVAAGRDQQPEEMAVLEARNTLEGVRVLAQLRCPTLDPEDITEENLDEVRSQLADPTRSRMREILNARRKLGQAGGSEGPERQLPEGGSEERTGS